MGEACVRGNASNGDGVYKSIDGGKTWRNVGLRGQPRHIGAVRVHPKNPDIVYVAALGHLWGPNDERGVYRSTDGGATWKQVLTRGPDAGAVDLAHGSLAIRACSTPASGRCAAIPTTSIAAAPAAASGNPPTAATPGPISRARARPARAACWAASASPFRPPIPSASGPSWKPPMAASSAPTTPAAPGPRSTSRTSSASAPGITPTSSPIPAERRHRLRAQHRHVPLHRRRPHLHRHPPAARRQPRPVDRARRSRSA